MTPEQARVAAARLRATTAGRPVGRPARREDSTAALQAPSSGVTESHQQEPDLPETVEVAESETEGEPVHADEERGTPPPTQQPGSLSRVVEGVAARIPVTIRGGLLDPGRRAVGALAVVGAVAAALAGVYLWRSQPEPVTVAPRAPASSAVPSSLSKVVATGPPASTPAASPTGVVVDVDGKVHDPGVYTLPAGSRVTDAVEAAGGPEKGADTTTVNLARTLVDGEKILVGVPGSPEMQGAAPAGGGPDAAGNSAAEPTLDVNAATAEQLEELPGIGPVLAERIVEYRTEHGAFGSVSELNEVSGIGEVTFADIEDKVRV